MIKFNNLMTILILILDSWRITLSILVMLRKPVKLSKLNAHECLWKWNYGGAIGLSPLEEHSGIMRQSGRGQLVSMLAQEDTSATYVDRCLWRNVNTV